jgi:exonuclease-1
MGVATTRHIDFCIHMTKMLLHYEVTPIIVLDGMPLPAKEKTNAERRKARDSNREMGLEALRQNDFQAAEKFFQKAIHVTTSMGRDLKRRLWNELRVACITAPFEGNFQRSILPTQSSE